MSVNRGRGAWRLVVVILMVSVVVGAAAFLAGREPARVVAGWAGTRGPGHMAYTYRLFTGSESVQITGRIGQTLSLEYRGRVASGLLTVRVLSPDGRDIWAVTLHKDGAGSTLVPITDHGVYRVVVQGRKAVGGFDLAWTVE